MSNNENTETQHPCSEPKPIPKEPALTIDNSAQCASFISQRSSSIDTFGSNSPTDSAINYFPESAAEDGKEAGARGSVSEEGGAGPKPWMCNNEAVPASMLHPSHQSTPVKNNRYLPTAGEGDHAAGAETDDGKSSENEEGKPRREVFMPGDLHTPITGFETMEARSKFTVYKIHVQKTASEEEEEEEPPGWFIFRRYSDFLHLNERLKHLFPGFRLSLPPKRWFRDNFDSNFLEDRMLGLQAFLDNITGHKDICNSEPVRAFFCTDEPPGPHDSLEESRALCDTLEESIYSLRQEVQDKDGELSLLKEEVALYKSQVEILSNQLKAITGLAPSISLTKTNLTTPSCNTPESSGSNRSSLAECDPSSPSAPAAEEDKKNGEQVQPQQ